MRSFPERGWPLLLARIGAVLAGFLIVGLHFLSGSTPIPGLATTRDAEDAGPDSRLAELAREASPPPAQETEPPVSPAPAPQPEPRQEPEPDSDPTESPGIGAGEEDDGTPAGDGDPDSGGTGDGDPEPRDSGEED